jgi:hypothetical protein
MARRRPFHLTNTELPSHLKTEEKELVRLFINARCSRLLDIVAAATRTKRADLLAVCIARVLGEAELFSREAGDLLPRTSTTPSSSGTGGYTRQTPAHEVDDENDDDKADAA